MAGTTVSSIFEKDGQYLVQTVGTAAIVLGDVVAIDASNADTIVEGTAALQKLALGVAVAARRYSRTQTDDSIAVGEKVTVVTRGVVNITTTSGVTRGALVEAIDDGAVDTHSEASGDYASVIGIALTTAVAGALVKVLLMRG